MLNRTLHLVLLFQSIYEARASALRQRKRISRGEIQPALSNLLRMLRKADPLRRSQPQV